MSQAYCLKCRKKVEIKNPNRIIPKSKRPVTSGISPICGKKLFSIGKAWVLTAGSSAILYIGCLASGCTMHVIYIMAKGKR